jgi:septum formation protein
MLSPHEEQFYLASQSPRRRELLSQLGLRFIVQAVDIDESVVPGESPADFVRRLAEAKAVAVWNSAARIYSIPVLAADTIVVLDNTILGKPLDNSEACSMLQVLSGRQHQVLTGVALVCGERCESLVQTSAVSFTKLSTAQIQHYVASGEPADKAGSYAIQGRAATFVSYLQGSYSGVVGLPLYETCRLLRHFGIDVPL